MAAVAVGLAAAAAMAAPEAVAMAAAGAPAAVAVVALEAAAAAPAGAAAAEAQSITVADAAKTLGVWFRGQPGPQADVSFGPVEAGLRRAAHLPLSAFGRSFAAGGYCLSRALYHLEFMGLPKAPALAGLERSTAALIDRALPPGPPAVKRLVGMGKATLPVHPLAGGFGLLPLREHVQGRHAALAVRFMAGALGTLGSYTPGWVSVMGAILRSIHPAAHPLCLLVGWEAAGTRVLGCPISTNCPPLKRLVTALKRLPPVQRLGPDAPVPGSWCVACPLWGNPLLPAAEGVAKGGLELDFPDLALVPAFTTVGMAVQCRQVLTYIAPHYAAGVVLAPQFVTQYNTWYRTHVARALWRIDRYLELPLRLQMARDAVRTIDALVARLPPAWVAAVTAHGTAAAPPATEALQALASALGWRIGLATVPLLRLTVKVATHLQLGPQREALRHKHDAFAALAWPDGDPVTRSATVTAVFPRLWRLRWENRHKEPYWRLAQCGFAGFPMQQNYVEMGTPGMCPCGNSLAPGPQVHHFWKCPAIADLRSAITECADVVCELHHVWLTVPPVGMHPLVWDVVCLAAIAAMELGRQRLYRHRARDDPRVVSADMLRRIQAEVVADFWGRLGSFARAGITPRNWGDVPRDHCFLASSANGGVVFSGPPDVDSPPGSPV